MSAISLRAPWVNTSPGKYTILERHKPEYTQLIMKVDTGLLGDVASIVADYVADGKVMDRQGWLEYFGVDIGEETANVKEALKFENFNKIFHGRNPIDVMENVPVDKIRQVCESCLIPVVRPQIVQSNGLIEDFCLNILGLLAEHPIKGYPARYGYQTTVLQQHGKTKALSSALVIMLKGVVGRGKSWSKESQNMKERGQIQYLQDLNNKTGFGCKIPDALSQNTAVFLHHVITGELPLGRDATGVEGAMTLGCTVELVRNEENDRHVTSGGFKKYNLVGHPAISLLTMAGWGDGDVRIGVSVIREF